MKIKTIQQTEVLNEVYVVDEANTVNKGHHEYDIKVTIKNTDIEMCTKIIFQKGPRNEEGSIEGVMNEDLLEIVRHRLISFQEGEYRTREGAIALTKIEEALMWLEKRKEDRKRAGKLGTDKI